MKQLSIPSFLLVILFLGLVSPVGAGDYEKSSEDNIVLPHDLVPFSMDPAGKSKDGEEVKTTQSNVPWFVRNSGNDVIGEIRHPDYLANGDLHGPWIRLLRDSQGKIYVSVAYVQRFWRSMQFSIFIHFYESATSKVPLFTVEVPLAVYPKCPNAKIEHKNLPTNVKDPKVFDVVTHWNYSWHGGSFKGC